MIDIHNHLLIDVDDGPSVRDDAVKLLKQAIAGGITDIIVTPHHKSMRYYNSGNKIVQKLEELNDIIKEEGMNINIRTGQEIRINGEMLNDLKSGESITLNHSKYVLIELPFTDYPYYTDQLFFELQTAGYIPIIAHPERCRPILESPDKLYQLIEKGALAQVTASSVTGDLGKSLQKAGLNIISSNLVHFVASDAHDAELRPFALKEAYEVISSELGEDVTVRLKENAVKLLNNQDIDVGQPLKMKSYYKKKERRNKKFFGLF